MRRLTEMQVRWNECGFLWWPWHGTPHMSLAKIGESYWFNNGEGASQQPVFLLTGKYGQPHEAPPFLVLKEVP